MDNQGAGSGKEKSLIEAAALKAFKEDEKLDELPEEQLDKEPKEDAHPEDFKPFKDPEKLKKLKKEETTEEE
ncbi:MULTISPECIES: hypothetical protein [Carnobacterium]|uniref:Uncharacterized protein n=1 Tax=Carnobacterium antarcticum TaxID=2126436 RepID=A0ABW4NLB3_9LACT|nr:MULTISPECIES: hypothetical protein [unclassified Carnobacterium]ALV21603.1 hypothetical protein NY10_992 [Carnobacterium sp. CP1]QQP69623.1 hypothetical protein JHE06_08355 [Carnobacterium sp. CS13]